MKLVDIPQKDLVEWNWFISYKKNWLKIGVSQTNQSATYLLIEVSETGFIYVMNDLLLHMLFHFCSTSLMIYDYNFIIYSIELS